MLLVPASPRQSPIHGIGLFADEDIIAGTIVWAYGGGDMRHEIKLVNLWHQAARDWAWQHCYINPDTPDVMVLCGDDAIYMNFAQHPNTCVGPEVDGEATLICTNYIIKGQEITVPFASDADAQRKMSTSQKTKIAL